MKSKRVKHETQPEWINDEKKMAIKNRDALISQTKRQYKFWRHKTTALIRITISKYPKNEMLIRSESTKVMKLLKN